MRCDEVIAALLKIDIPSLRKQNMHTQVTTTLVQTQAETIANMMHIHTKIITNTDPLSDAYLVTRAASFRLPHMQKIQAKSLLYAFYMHLATYSDTLL